MQKFSKTVTPGESVTAFGLLPDAVTASLNNHPLNLDSVPDGVRFTVPATSIAGDLKLRLMGDGVTLEGVVSVKPRLDRVTLQGSSLRVFGAGWPLTGVNLTTDGAAVQTRVLVDGLEPEPSLEIIAGSDQDGDGVVGEAGELISARLKVQALSGQSVALPELGLNPAGGADSLRLEH